MQSVDEWGAGMHIWSPLYAKVSLLLHIKHTDTKEASVFLTPTLCLNQMRRSGNFLRSRLNEGSVFVWCLLPAARVITQTPDVWKLCRKAFRYHCWYRTPATVDLDSWMWFQRCGSVPSQTQTVRSPVTATLTFDPARGETCPRINGTDKVIRQSALLISFSLHRAVKRWTFFGSIGTSGL